MRKVLIREFEHLATVKMAPPPEEDDGVQEMAEDAFKNMVREIIKGTTPQRKAILVSPVTNPTSVTIPKKRKLLIPQTARQTKRHRLQSCQEFARP